MGKPPTVSHLITYQTSKVCSLVNEEGLKNKTHCKNKSPDWLTQTHPVTPEMDLFWGIKLLRLNRQLPSTYYEVMNERICKHSPLFAFLACTGSTWSCTLLKTAISKSKKARFCKTTWTEFEFYCKDHLNTKFRKAYSIKWH